MISCTCCQAIVDQVIQTDADELFDYTITDPDFSHGKQNICEKCGRNWTLVCTTLSYEGDLIPANAVLEDESDYPALTELEAREAMEGF